jgi:hypothetical protein
VFIYSATVNAVISHCDTGRQVAVVSNNAESAVRTYLELQGLTDRIAPYQPRPSHY